MLAYGDPLLILRVKIFVPCYQMTFSLSDQYLKNVARACLLKESFEELPRIEKFGA